MCLCRAYLAVVNINRAVEPGLREVNKKKSEKCEIVPQFTLAPVNILTWHGQGKSCLPGVKRYQQIRGRYVERKRLSIIDAG